MGSRIRGNDKVRAVNSYLRIHSFAFLSVLYTKFEFKKLPHYPHPISIAPMMDYTDRHLRYLFRLMTRRTLLYTEMITTEAILRGDRHHLLDYHPTEHPLALQLGGSDPKKLAACTRIAAEYGYDEVNLNAGCPSDRVQQGKFGACLMKEPALVADCLKAMQESSAVKVTLKTRIGVDDLDSYLDLTHFIEQVSASGCDTFTIHARKAWLHGLSPKENRTIPPLRHDVVYQLKKDFPHLTIILNGGIQTLEQIQAALEIVDGVMIGRHACNNSYFFSDIDKLFYSESHPALSRLDIVEKMLPYIQTQLDQGVRLTSLSRHLLSLFFGTPNARQWRRHLSENAHKIGAGIEVIREAMNLVNIPEAEV
jgi:tRNA-dihydrouridine synthase A